MTDSSLHLFHSPELVRSCPPTREVLPFLFTEAEENQILEKPQNGLHIMAACFKTVMLFCEITFITLKKM